MTSRDTKKFISLRTTLQLIRINPFELAGMNPSNHINIPQQPPNQVISIKPPTPPHHLGEFPIGSYLKVTDSTKSSVTFLVLVRGFFFYII